MKENIEVQEPNIESWAETRRHRMAGELHFWQIRRSWLGTERD